MKIIKKIKALIRLYKIKKVVSFRFAELYSSIDNLPIWNYNKILETGNLRYMAKTDDFSKHFRYDKKKAFLNWQKINDQYIDYFGVNDNYQRILELKGEMAVNYYDWKVLKIPVARSYYNMAKDELETMQSGAGSGSESQEYNVGKQIFYIEREMGFKLEEKNLPVKQFFLYINELSEIAKKLTKHGKKAQI